jgi:hypothetical protein
MVSEQFLSSFIYASSFSSSSSSSSFFPFIFLAMAENIKPVSEMDSSNPFFLNHGDSPGAMIVSKPLNGENYNSWKRAMVMALSAKNKLSFVNGTLPKPSNLYDSQGLACTCYNNMVLSWLLNFVSTEIANSIIYIDDTSEI